MKAILFFTLILLCCGCKTYNVYRKETKLESIYSTPAKAQENRFTNQFHRADSLFSVEQSKHLNPPK